MTKDSYGTEICEGDIIHFTYGIPPVTVDAPVVLRDGKLIAITEGHKPSECPVANLERHVGYLRTDRTSS